MNSLRALAEARSLLSGAAQGHGGGRASRGICSHLSQQDGVSVRTSVGAAIGRLWLQTFGPSDLGFHRY